MEKLKPCPFCGSQAKLDFDAFGFARVKCTACGAQSAAKETCLSTCETDGQKVSEAWNARADTVKHGHYIINDDGDSRCSLCGETYLDCTQNYCPNCGARMDEPKERED